MLIEGLNLMAVGMTTVFGFLALLVTVLQVAARVFEHYGDRWPDPVTVPEPSNSAIRSSGRAEIAVALAAIAAHHRRQG